MTAVSLSTVESYMKALNDMREMNMSATSSPQFPPQLGYLDFYKQYLTSVYLTARAQTNQTRANPSQLTNEKAGSRKSLTLWSPAKLLELENSESGEECGSGD